MANTYTHRIVSLKKNNEIYPNIVKSAVIEITASDGTNQFSKNYAYTMEPVLEGPALEFIEYNNLTETDVVSWIISDPASYDSFIFDIDKCLQDSIHTEVSSNFPWS